MDIAIAFSPKTDIKVMRVRCMVIKKQFSLTTSSADNYVNIVPYGIRMLKELAERRSTV